MSKLHEHKAIKNTLITLAFPVLMILAVGLMLTVAGQSTDISMLDIKTLVRSTGTTSIVAFALSFNLTSGRFDLSLGSQRLVGTIIGANLALSLGLGGIWLLIFSLFFGLVFGFIVGLIFITVRIPALVLGIGMGLILETVAYISSNGFGLNLFGKPGIEFLSEIDFTIGIVFVVSLFTLVLLSYTQYGYHLRAIEGSQRIAQNSGIKVFKHAVMSYALAGSFVGISGILDSAYRTQMEASLGFTSNGPVFAGIFPMSLGNYIGKWSSPAIGIVVASLTLKIFSIGLGRMQLSDAMTSVVNMVLFVLFLIYLANQDFFSHRRQVRQRILLAQQKKKELAFAN